MTTIHELTQQLSTFEARREALTAELNEAKLALAAARNAVVEGTRDATRRVTEQQATSTALEEALRTLDRRIDDTRTALQAAQAEAARQTWVQRLIDVARQATAADEDYQAALEEANALLTPFVDRMLRAHDTRVAARNAFLQETRSLDLSSGAERALIAEIEQQHGVSLDAVLTPWVGSHATRADRDCSHPPITPYGGNIEGIISGILRQREHERYTAEKQARIAAQDQRRRESEAATRRRLAALEEAARQEAEQRAQQEAEEREQAQAYWDSIYRTW